MIKRLAQGLPIKPGEWAVSGLMFLYIFGVLTFYYILKPLRSALFLSELPASDLPKAYLLTALIAGPLVTLVFKLSGRLSAVKLLTATNIAIIGSLFVFRWAIGRNLAQLPYAYFVYVQIVSVVSVGQFWLLAGYIYDSRQAKRIYGVLGAGAIAGASAGSFLSDFLKRMNSESMLMICVGICLGLILVSQLAWRYRRAEAERITEARKFEPSGERFYDLYKLVFGSRHLVLMVLLIFLTMIASQITDWQVDYATQQAFQHLPKSEMAQEIKGFRGRFNLVTNLAGILLQLTLTGFVVSRLGIGASILFLPAGLFFSSIAVFTAPSLRSTTMALGFNSVFRYSINRSGLELLYLPLSPEVRKRIKLFIDVFIDRFGRAAAAFVILLFTAESIDFGLRGTALAVVIITGVCLVVAVRLRNSYVEAFRQQLALREMDLESQSRFVTDPASVRLLVGTLESAQERQILYALRLLQSVRGVDFAPQLLPLLNHASPYVREEATRTLRALPGEFRAEAERLLTDGAQGVRQAAVEYLCARDPARTSAELEQLLRHENLDIRVAAAHYASGRGDFRPSLELIRNLLNVEGDRASEAREAAARLAVRLPAAESVPLLKDLLKDPDRQVAAAAARAAGAAGHVELVAEIIPMLADRRLRAASRETLVQYGARITGTLGDALCDPQRNVALRHEIPWILARIPSEGSVEILISNLGAGDPLLKYRVVKALNRLHESNPGLLKPRPKIAERIYAETQAYYEALALSRVVAPDGKKNGRRLLGRALKERLDQNLEIIFRLLGLQYPQKDMYSAYHALKGARAERRTAAIEFLDNMLHKNLKSIILPLLEESSTERLIDRASRLFGIQTRERKEALRMILDQPDVWLKVCALYQIGDERISDLADMCRKLSSDSDPLIRETAEWALKCIENRDR
jgi:AAA family ATP:ADP antiporter